MIEALDPTDEDVAARIVEIQRAAYAVEAQLMGFDRIPQLRETIKHVRSLTDLVWRGSFHDGRLAAVIAWSVVDGTVDIDRLAVDPSHARQGHGRRLVGAVPTDLPAVVATGAANAPARSLYLSEGFSHRDDDEIEDGVLMARFVRDAAAGDAGTAAPDGG